MNNIYNFALNNFKKKIQLEEIAAVADLVPNSFCRYFKAHTNKTYIEFLNEVKIGQACKLLIKQMNPSQVCFEIGFNNFTHFNNQFKKITGITPKQYQQKYA